MKTWVLLAGLLCIYSSVSAAIFYNIDTTSPLHCYLSAKFQNRIMIENGRIKKVVASECERLSIQMEEITGQAFVYARDLNPKPTSISVISDIGLVQDVYINFIDRMPEVVILQDAEKTVSFDEDGDRDPSDRCTLQIVEEIICGNIPVGYVPTSISSGKWSPKKGVDLRLKSKLEGSIDVIYVYEVSNTLKHQQTLLECELECEGSRWVFLETNTLSPKQKILSIISVEKYE